jgi:hypothetical protein
MKADTYFVWRRNDGYVSASCNFMPQGWRHPNGEVTFEKLLETPCWGEAADMIRSAREASSTNAAQGEQLSSCVQSEPVVE